MHKRHKEAKITLQSCYNFFLITFSFLFEKRMVQCSHSIAELLYYFGLFRFLVQLYWEALFFFLDKLDSCRGWHRNTDKFSN